MPPKTKGKRKPKKQPTQKQKQKQSQKVVVNIQTTAGKPSTKRRPIAKRERPPQPPQPPQQPQQPQMFLSSQPTAQQIAYEFSRINMDRPRTIAEPVPQPQPQIYISPTFENRPQTQISPDISPVIRPQTEISPVIAPQISPEISPFIQPQTQINPSFAPETSIRSEINPSFNVEPNISNTTQPPNISQTYIGTGERHRPMERQPARTIDELMEPDRFEPMRRPRPEQDDEEEVIDFTIPEAQAIRFDEINPMMEQQREQARGEFDEFTNMTVPQLREELRNRNQSTSGNKAELLRRIREGTPKGKRGRPRNP